MWRTAYRTDFPESSKAAISEMEAVDHGFRLAWSLKPAGVVGQDRSDDAIGRSFHKSRHQTAVLCCDPNDAAITES